MRRRRPGPPALVLVAALVCAGCAQEGATVPLPVMTALSATAASVPAAHLAARPPGGAADSEVRLSGDGYPANGRVLFTFHGHEVGDTTADGVGRFADVVVRVPGSFRDSAPGTQVTIGATSGPFYAETPFVLTR